MADETISLQQSIRVLRSRRNALAPISRLPPELLASIFSFLFPSPDEHAFHLKWIYVTHVCRRWRETALNHPCLWSHINLSLPEPASTAEILARAKTVPLRLEVDFSGWKQEYIDAFLPHLEAHISHTRYLRICGGLLHGQPLLPLERLVSSAPTLESLSLLHCFGRHSSSGQVVLPFNLFNCTTPSLTSLELEGCDVSWKSPLLKGLQSLEIRWPSAEARPKLEDWLDALNEMPQLKTLSLYSATPVAPPALFISEPSRTVTLPSLSKFYISGPAIDCALALAHLVMPALTSLNVVAASYHVEGEDVRPLISYVARNVCGMQDTEPLRSIVIKGDGTQAEVFALTKADADLDGYVPWRYDVSVPERLTFNAIGTNWRPGVFIETFDALLTLLPLKSMSSFTAERLMTPLSKEFWLSQAPGWPSLEQVRLNLTAIKAFREMLVEDAPSDGPRLPSLTTLILFEVVLNMSRSYALSDMLIERVEQGVPLDVLDLRKCFVSERAIQLLGEIVVDLKEPRADYRTLNMLFEPGLSNLHEETWYGVGFG